MEYGRHLSSSPGYKGQSVVVSLSIVRKAVLHGNWMQTTSSNKGSFCSTSVSIAAAAVMSTALLRVNRYIPKEKLISV